jgi:predicted RecA/RadA family phage recombinase
MSKSSVRMGLSSPLGRSFRSAVSVLFGSRQPSLGPFGSAFMALVVVASLLVVASPARADGIEWTIRTSAADNNWRSVAYGDGLWVAVASSGSGNRVMTSRDGITWTVRASAADIDWRSVAYGDGLWVAVASSGSVDRVMTSPDGITWTSRAATSENEWVSVAHGQDGSGGPLWVAVAPNGDSRVMTSPNGITWTASNSATQLDWHSVAYGNGRWVATSRNGTTDRVMNSENGTTWVPQTSADNQWRSVAFGQDGVGGPLWVAVAGTGSGDRVMTSPNGVNWTARISAVDNNWDSVAYGDGLWVAVATSGSGDRVMTSPNGVNWTARISAVDNLWESVAFGNGLWVAVASTGSGNRVMTSGAMTVASSPAVLPPSVSCVPLPPVVGARITCTVAGGDAGIDVLWRAAYNPMFAEAGVTLDASGSGEFSFTVPAAALDEELTVELVEWLAPVSLGVVGGPVPSSVPSGEGPVDEGLMSMWRLGLLALVALGLLRRGMRAQA